MTTAILSTYRTFTPYHHTLKKLGHSPSECCVFGKIASLITSCGQAFVSLRAFAEELGYTRETISRAISKLEKAGRIKRTAQKKYGLFPYVEILPNADQKPQTRL